MDPLKPMQPETARKGISLLLSFLLSLFASLLALLLVLQYTLLNEGFLRARMQESQYAAHLLETLDIGLHPTGTQAASTRRFSPRLSVSNAPKRFEPEVARPLWRYRRTAGR
ncbi:MAG: hypothetical protein ACLSAP_11550 [Oscillospiraceae bacterium]